MTKFGQTTNYTAKDHIKDLEKYLGKGTIDIILMNNQKPSPQTLLWYEKYKEIPVIDDLDEKSGYKVYRARLIKDLKVERGNLHQALAKKNIAFLKSHDETTWEELRKAKRVADILIESSPQLAEKVLRKDDEE